MGARLRSWWQQIKKHRVAIGVVAIVLESCSHYLDYRRLLVRLGWLQRL